MSPPPRQIEHGKDEQPEHIDDVPEEADIFEAFLKGQFCRLGENLTAAMGKKPEPDDHVDQVQAGNQEIESEKPTR